MTLKASLTISWNNSPVFKIEYPTKETRPLLHAGIADLTSLRSTIPTTILIPIPYDKGSPLELLPKTLVLKIGN